MRIGDLNTALVNPAGAPAVDKHPERTTAAGSEDAVNLSRLSQAVAAESAGEVRLDELREQVKAGTYQVPAEEVSKSIVRFHEE